jgi:hypothetical protein
MEREYNVQIVMMKRLSNHAWRLSCPNTFTGCGIIERHDSVSKRNNLLSGMFPLTQAP